MKDSEQQGARSAANPAETPSVRDGVDYVVWRCGLCQGSGRAGRTWPCPECAGVGERFRRETRSPETSEAKGDVFRQAAELLCRIAEGSHYDDDECWLMRARLLNAATRAR